MKKHFIFSIALAASICAGQGLVSVESAAAWSSQEEAQFDQQLKSELLKQGKNIYEIENQVIKGSKGFKGDLQKEFKTEMDSLQAKETLYKKFQHSPLLQSPDIRAKLLVIFQKPVITEQDIQDLQTLVDQQKSKK